MTAIPTRLGASIQVNNNNADGVHSDAMQQYTPQYANHVTSSMNPKSQVANQLSGMTLGESYVSPDVSGSASTRGMIPQPSLQTVGESFTGQRDPLNPYVQSFSAENSFNKRMNGPDFIGVADSGTVGQGQQNSSVKNVPRPFNSFSPHYNHPPAGPNNPPRFSTPQQIASQPSIGASYTAGSPRPLSYQRPDMSISNGSTPPIYKSPPFSGAGSIPNFSESQSDSRTSNAPQVHMPGNSPIGRPGGAQVSNQPLVISAAPDQTATNLSKIYAASEHPVINQSDANTPLSHSGQGLVGIAPISGQLPSSHFSEQRRISLPPEVQSASVQQGVSPASLPQRGQPLSGHPEGLNMPAKSEMRPTYGLQATPTSLQPLSADVRPGVNFQSMAQPNFPQASSHAQFPQHRSSLPTGMPSIQGQQKMPHASTKQPIQKPDEFPTLISRDTSMTNRSDQIPTMPGQIRPILEQPAGHAYQPSQPVAHSQPRPAFPQLLAGQTYAQQPASQAFPQPPAGQTYAQQPTGQAFPQPAAGQTYAQPTSQAFAQLPTGQTYAQQPASQAFPQPPAGQTNAQKPTSQAFAQLPTGQMYAQQPTSQAIPQSPAGQAYAQQPTSQAFPQPPAGQTYPHKPYDLANIQPISGHAPQHSTGHVYPQSPARQTYPQSPSGQVNPQTSTAQTHPQTPIVQSRAQTPTPQPYPQRPSGQTYTRHPIGQSYPQPATGKSFPQPPTGQPYPQPPIGQAYAQPPGQPYPQPPIGQAYAQPPGQPYPQPPIGQAYAQPSGQPYPQPPTGQPYPQPPSGQPYAQPPAGQPYPQPPSGQPYPQPPAGQAYPQQPGYDQQAGRAPPAIPKARLDPDQIPSPVVVIDDDKTKNTGLQFCTDEPGKVPPLVTTDFTSIDRGNAISCFIRATTHCFPATSDMAKQSAVPMGLVIKPFGQPRPGESIPPILDTTPTNGPIRCNRCKAYMSPNMKFFDGGRQFQCLMCTGNTEVPESYHNHLDHTGHRIDIYERPELFLGSYEFTATLEYCKNDKPVKPPAYIFMIDVSPASVKSQMVHLLCAELQNLLELLPSENGETEVRVGIVTYSNVLHFYNLKESLATPQQMVVTDVSDVFLPLLDGFLVSWRDSKAMIIQLLNEIPNMFTDCTSPDVILGPVIQAGLDALKASERPGKLFVFHSNLPTADAPGKLKPREDRKLLGNEKEKQQLNPLSTFYTNLVEDCVKHGCSVDIFAFPAAYIDVASISPICAQTGGNLYMYPKFDVQEHGEVFIRELERDISRPTAFDAVLRVRTNQGIRPTDFIGNLYMKNTTDVELASIDCDKTITVELKHDDKINTEQGAIVQVALLYTSVTGQRRLRIHNSCFAASDQLAELYRSCDQDTLTNVLAKKAAKTVLRSSMKEVKEILVMQTATILACYRQNCSSPSNPGQLILPECLKLLPVYVNSIMKNDALAAGPDMPVDYKAWLMHQLMSMDTLTSVMFFYPCLIPVLDPSHKPRRCSWDKVESTGVFVVDNGIMLHLWIGRDVPVDWLQSTFKVGSPSQINPKQGIPEIDSDSSRDLRCLITDIEKKKQKAMKVLIVRQGDPFETTMRRLLVDDTGPGNNLSYVDFLCHIHKEIRAKLS